MHYLICLHSLSGVGRTYQAIPVTNITCALCVLLYVVFYAHKALYNTNDNIVCNVLDPPQLTMLPADSVYHIRVYTSLQLVCIAEGNPVPSVRWYKNGIPTSHRQSFNTLSGQSFITLSVSSMVLNSMEYRCEGINHIGKSKHIEEATITVKTESK